MNITELLLALYFLPTLVALCNQGASLGDKLAALILNVMLGWTVIGWFFVYCFASANHKGRAEVQRATANFYLRADAKHHRG
jgi:hypothetical protein